MTGHRVVLRPRSFFETGDLALVLVRAHWRLFASLLVWVIPAAVLSFLLQQFAGVPTEWVFAIDIGLSSILGGAFTLLCGDLMLDSAVSVRALHKRFLRLLPGFFFTRIAGWILMAVTIGFGFRLTAFIPESSLLERGGLSASFTRSNALLRATPGRAIGLGIVTLGLICLGSIGVELGRLAFRELFSLTTVDAAATKDLATWAELLGVALIQPYIAALRFLLYIDCRTRREGWDLQVQFSSLIVANQSPLRSATSSEAA